MSVPAANGVRLAGGVGLICDGVEITVKRRKIHAMITLLALSSPLPVSREKLMAYLWENADPASARNSLRQILYILRRELGSAANDILHVTPDSVSLEAATVDVTAALGELRGGMLPQLVERLPSLFLEMATGTEDVSSGYSSWLAVQRQRAHDDAVGTLSARLNELEPPHLEGEAVARLLSRMEPTHEAACRYLIRLHHANGNIADALQLYNDLWQHLDEEFDCLPSEATQSLIAEIKAAGLTTLEAETSSVLHPLQTSVGDNRRRPPVVWVEQFGYAGVPEQTTLRAQGLRDSLIATLCRFREWRIVDGSMVDPPPPTVQGPLFLISGRIVARDSDAELSVQFRDVWGQVIWSETVELQSETLRKIERRITRRIAMAFDIHISSARLALFQDSGDEGGTPDDSWFLAQALLRDWRPESEDKAEALFRRLASVHPDFAPASTGLAQVLNTRHLIRPGIARSAAAHQEALSLALRAVGLDPLDAKAQLTLGWSFALVGLWDNAAATFDVAIDLNDRDAWVLASSALGFAYVGEVDRAVRIGQQMAELSFGISRLHWAYYSGVLFIASDYEAAVGTAHLGAGATNYIDGWKSAALALSGRQDDGRQELARYFSDIRRRWWGTQPATDEAITDWLLTSYPIRDRSVTERLMKGLAACGAPMRALPERSRITGNA
ncbi:BTAD domain-containing putative transcriptional regulator [Sedimentitalea todarodis]|uniref:BTAD domain-containing putative transcriptional regulator n=1 Tax=Sedimentitalea todarodis TaxID=1631240 RepID=A0ABU3VE91_9RHOB|nr:BTAD domain-containing putative transcriptional regulator [Sedimentitalea todarodis]MDU9004492.1 BTAD domain-containing putative transcriptional regulator [Sedimentitalea todarodis]